jgi:hypothetical protein
MHLRVVPQMPSPGAGKPCAVAPERLRTYCFHHSFPTIPNLLLRCHLTHVNPSIPSYFNEYLLLDRVGFIRSASELVAARDPVEATEDENGGYALGTLSPKDSFIGGPDEASPVAFQVSETHVFFFFFSCARRASRNPYFEDLDLNKYLF